MNREEVLEKAQSKKAVVGEMEQTKMNKGNWIAIIVGGVLAIAFMIVEGLFGHYSSIYAIACICYAWASVFYFCQYFVAKRPWPVLIGAVLHGLASVGMLTCFILSLTGVIA